MISVPYQINQNAVGNLFKALIDLGDYDKTKWRLFAHDGDNNFVEYPSGSAQNLERGNGYWLLISDKNSRVLDLGSNITAPDNNQENLFALNLQSGWNMIGNPYTVPISWENVREFNASIDIGTIKLFNGSYENGDQLLPFQGGFVYLEGSSIPVEIPFASQNPIGSRLKGTSFQTDLSAPNWALDFAMEQGGIINNIGGIGMHVDAKDTKDRFDDLNPPRFASYLELNSPHPEHTLGYFSRDIVKTTDQYKWQINVNSSNEDPIILSWDNSGFGESSTDFFLYNIQSRVLLDMRVSNEFSLANNSTIEDPLW